jgi:membrane protein YdbS with pleckstrin-like domain
MRDDDSLIKVIVFSGLRIIVIMAVVCFIFAFAKLLQYIIGREIVQEEEIVIVHEFASEEEAREARANKKSRKSKKSKSQ